MQKGEKGGGGGGLIPNSHWNKVLFSESWKFKNHTLNARTCIIKLKGSVLGGVSGI